MVPRSIVVNTRADRIDADSHNTCPVFKSFSDRQKSAIAERIERLKNEAKRAIGDPCPSRCPCDTARTDAIFRDAAAVPKRFKAKYKSGRCAYQITGTYQIKTARVVGQCNTPNEEDDFGEIELASFDDAVETCDQPQKSELV